MEKNKANSIKIYFEIIKYLINPTNYFRELNKKINYYLTVFFSALILLIYYIFQDKLVNFLNNSYLEYILTSLNKVPIVLYKIIFFLLIVFMLKNFLFSKKINIYDIAIEKFSIFLMITYISMDFKTIFNVYYHINILNIVLSILIFFVIYVLRLSIYNFLNRIKNSNKITLWDIYSNNFNIDNLENLKIYDSDKIMYDLFGREQINNNLYFSITSLASSSECFKIGVIGEWGSGKSSIIELTKNRLLNDESKDHFIIIDDFEPWVIKSQDTLILTIYNTIIENLGKNISYFKRKKVQNALINITTNIPYIGKGIGNYFENRIDDYSEYKEIKADLEEKLKKSDKRLVFVIDNLDRMNSDNVLFLLTIIETLFKLPNITYIVAYDKKRLKSIFRPEKIDAKYIEKIVNKEILVPKIHNSDKQFIFYNCLKNCIQHSDDEIIFRKIDYEIDDQLYKKIASKFTNIRDFIRFLNFIIYDINTTSFYFYRNDLLILKTVEFLDYELYLKISKNKNFITKKAYSKTDFSIEDMEFYNEVKDNKLFDLLELLAIKNSNFYKLKNDNYTNTVLDGFLDGMNCISSIYSFDNYFSLSKYSKYYLEIKNFIEINNPSYEDVNNFFETDKNYLRDYFIGFLLVVLSKNRFINNNNFIIIKLYIILYFVFQINNDLFDNYEETLDNFYRSKLNDISYDKNDKNKIINTEFCQKYQRNIQDIFTKLLKTPQFNKLNQFSSELKEMSCFNNFCDNLNNSNNETNAKIIKNCIEIASNNHITQKEQIEKIQQELEVLFKNNIKK